MLASRFFIYYYLKKFNIWGLKRNMLTFLRKLSETWVLKGILALTALSFVSLFGAGSFSNLRRADNIAVGTKDIDLTGHEFVYEFVNEIGKINKLAKKHISIKDAIAKGMPEVMLAKKANEFIMYSLNKELNIDIDKPTLGAVIRSEPIFINQDGVFSSEQYSYYLSTTGMTQKEFENKMAADIKNRFISVPMMRSVEVPDVLSAAIYKYQNEKRSGKYFSLKLSDMNIADNPSDDDLKNYYEGYEDNYMAPEYRRATVMFLPFSKIKADIAVSEDDLKNRYEEMKASFTVPEKRNVEQILVSDQKKADEVMKALKDGKDFVETAKTVAGQTKEDTELGLVTADSLITEVADLAFEAKKGEVVGPVESYLGFHIVRVTDIVKGSTATYAEKRDELLDAAKRDMVSDRTTELMEKVDDAFGLGKSIEDTAKDIGATVIALPDLDITGVGRDGKKSDYKFINTEFLTNLYSSDMQVGQVSVTMESDEGIAVFRLDNIDAPAVKDFAEVKDDLYKLWQNDQRQAKLDAIVKEAADDADKGVPFAKIAAKYKSKIINTGKTGRVATKDMPAEVVDSLFTVDGKGDIVHSKTKDGYVFVTLDDVIAPTKDNEDIDIEQVKDDLKNELAESLYASFVKELGERYDLKVNRATVEKALDAYRNRSD